MLKRFRLNLTRSPRPPRGPRPLRRCVRLAAALGAGMLGGCRYEPRDALARYTGLRPCAAAAVRYVDSPADDVLRFEVVARDGGCTPDLASSIDAASRDSAGGGCAALLARAGSCAYTHAGKSVAVRQAAPPSGGQARYVVDAW